MSTFDGEHQNNSISFRTKLNLIPHILLLSICQNTFAAEEVQNGLIALVDTPLDSETSTEIEGIDPATGAKIIIIDVKTWSEPAETDRVPDCEVVKTKANENIITEPGLEANRRILIDTESLEVIGTDTYVETASEEAHNFALNPFGISGVFKGSSIEYVLEHFGLPYEIDIGSVRQLQFSKFAPVNYLYPGIEITFGYESDWVGVAGVSPAYKPFKVVDVVQGLIITSSDVKLRYGVHVGMKWGEVVEKLGKPKYGYRYESKIINYDTIIFEFEVDSNETVTKIVWPLVLGH